MLGLIVMVWFAPCEHLHHTHFTPTLTTKFSNFKAIDNYHCRKGCFAIRNSFAPQSPIFFETFEDIDPIVHSMRLKAGGG